MPLDESPKKKRARKTPEQPPVLATDGFHYVREAGASDKHKLRFVVDQHRLEGFENNRSLPRHVETQKDGEAMMVRLTKLAHQRNPALAPKPEGPTPEERKAARLTKVAARRVEKAAQLKAYFPTTRFVCRQANSVAQVWQCVKTVWQQKPTGRRKKGGRPADVDKLPHIPGEYAVLQGVEAVVDRFGKPRVFSTWMEAEAEMLRLYHEHPEEDRFPSGDGTKNPVTVYANPTFSVHFDPDYNGINQPFNIYSTVFQKIVPHPIQGDGSYPWKFRKITSAIEEADRLDREARGA